RIRARRPVVHAVGPFRCHRWWHPAFAPLLPRERRWRICGDRALAVVFVRAFTIAASQWPRGNRLRGNLGGHAAVGLPAVCAIARGLAGHGPGGAAHHLHLPARHPPPLAPSDGHCAGRGNPRDGCGAGRRLHTGGATTRRRTGDRRGAGAWRIGRVAIQFGDLAHAASVLGWHAWQAHPLLGIGLRSIQPMIDASGIHMVGYVPSHLHNGYLQALVGLGSIGAGLLLAAFTLLVHELRRARRAGAAGGATYWALLGCLGIVLIVNASDFLSWHNDYMRAPLELLLGCCFALSLHRRRGGLETGDQASAKAAGVPSAEPGSTTTTSSQNASESMQASMRS